MTVRKAEMDISIERISEVAADCRLYRWELMRYGNAPVNVAVSVKANIDEDMAFEQITLRLGVTYTYMRSMVKRPLLQHTVDAVFSIPSMAEYVDFTPGHDRIAIPPSVMSMMLGVAIGALRGMIAKVTAGTPLENRPLPLINISGLVSRLIYGTTPSRATIPVDEPVIS